LNSQIVEEKRKAGAVVVQIVVMAKIALIDISLQCDEVMAHPIEERSPASKRVTRAMKITQIFDLPLRAGLPRVKQIFTEIS